MRRSRHTVWVAGLVSIVALLAVNAWISNRSTHRIVDNEKWVAHSLEVLQTLEGVRANVAEAEADQRGFLIRGESRYLRALQQAADGTAGRAHSLVALVADNPEQESRAAELETLLQRRVVALRRTASVFADEGAAAAQGTLGGGNGERVLERSRALIDTMWQTEDALLARRLTATGRSLHVKTFTSMAATLVGIAAVVFAFVFFRRMLAQRNRVAAQAEERARYEAALGELRQHALSNVGVESLMAQAMRIIATTLDVPLVKVLELLPSGDDFVLRAGLGWKEGRVGKTLVSAGKHSQAGYTLHSVEPRVAGDLTTCEPVVVDRLREDQRFAGAGLLHEHGVVSGMTAIIHDRQDRPYGVLGIHATRRRVFTTEEQRFLQTMANVLSSALQQRRADAALRDSEVRFRVLANSAPGFVWTSLPDGRCDYVNQHWCDSTGLGLEKTQGMGWVSAIHPDDVDQTVEHWMDSMKTGEPFEHSCRFRTRDGSYRWHLTRALPMRDAEGHVVKWFGNAMDIEEHKRMEDELIAADRNKNEFLAMLGHELRNPLAPIVNAVELLERRADPAVQWEVGVIDRQVRHISRLVDDLLDASRIAHGRVELRREVTDIERIVTGAIDVARPLIEARRHEIDVELPREKIRLDADATRLIQAFGNVLTNAANYTERGGHISLHVERQGADVLIEVADTGVGIDPEVLPHVFEIFQRGAGAGGQAPGGLGIGLALTRQLIEMHGGNVEAASEGRGHGSEFRVRLPVLPEEPAGPDTHGNEKRAEDAIRPCRVLIVDDNELIAETFARLLSGKGCETRTAGDGETALRISREYRPQVVFLDVGLPDMDGFEVARRLRSEPTSRKALLVAVTGYGRAQNATCDTDGIFTRHLIKPVRFEVVEHLIGEFQAEEAAAHATEGGAAVLDTSAGDGAAFSV